MAESDGDNNQVKEKIENEITENQITENILNENESQNEIFNKKYYNIKKRKYICDVCFSEYKSKQNLVKHLLNKKNCNYKQKINTLLFENKNILKKDFINKIENENKIENKDEIENKTYRDLLYEEYEED